MTNLTHSPGQAEDQGLLLFTVEVDARPGGKEAMIIREDGTRAFHDGWCDFLADLDRKNGKRDKRPYEHYSYGDADKVDMPRHLIYPRDTTEILYLASSCDRWQGRIPDLVVVDQCLVYQPGPGVFSRRVAENLVEADVNFPHGPCRVATAEDFPHYTSVYLGDFEIPHLLPRAKLPPALPEFVYPVPPIVELQRRSTLIDGKNVEIFCYNGTEDIFTTPKRDGLLVTAKVVRLAAKHKWKGFRFYVIWPTFDSTSSESNISQRIQAKEEADAMFPYDPRIRLDATKDQCVRWLVEVAGFRLDRPGEEPEAEKPRKVQVAGAKLAKAIGPSVREDHPPGPSGPRPEGPGRVVFLPVTSYEYFEDGPRVAGLFWEDGTVADFPSRGDTPPMPWDTSRAVLAVPTETAWRMPDYLRVQGDDLVEDWPGLFSGRVIKALREAGVAVEARRVEKPSEANLARFPGLRAEDVLSAADLKAMGGYYYIAAPAVPYTGPALAAPTGLADPFPWHHGEEDIFTSRDRRGLFFSGKAAGVLAEGKFRGLELMPVSPELEKSTKQEKEAWMATAGPEAQEVWPDRAYAQEVAWLLEKGGRL